MIKRFNCNSAPVAAFCSQCRKIICAGEKCVVIARFQWRAGVEDILDPDRDLLDLDSWPKDMGMHLASSRFRIEFEVPAHADLFTMPVIKVYHVRNCGIGDATRRRLPGDFEGGKRR
jgi:hypothetical protein